MKSFDQLSENFNDQPITKFPNTARTEKVIKNNRMENSSPSCPQTWAGQKISYCSSMLTIFHEKSDNSICL